MEEHGIDADKRTLAQSVAPSPVPSTPTSTPTYVYHALSVHHGMHDEEIGE